MYGQYPCSEQKQWEANVKVKEMDPTWSQNCLFPIINPPFFWGILVMVSSIRFPDLAVHTGYCECSEVGLGCQTTWLTSCLSFLIQK